jgi:hypothetical protein
MEKQDRKKKLPSNLRKYFWDVDFEKLNLKDNRVFILERLLNYGTFDTFKWIFRSYTSNEVKDLIVRRGINSFSKNSYYFWKEIDEEGRLWKRG